MMAAEAAAEKGPELQRQVRVQVAQGGQHERAVPTLAGCSGELTSWFAADRRGRRVLGGRAGCAPPAVRLMHERQRFELK